MYLFIESMPYRTFHNSPTSQIKLSVLLLLKINLETQYFLDVEQCLVPVGVCTGYNWQPLSVALSESLHLACSLYGSTAPSLHTEIGKENIDQQKLWRWSVKNQLFSMMVYWYSDRFKGRQSCLYDSNL